LRAEGLPGFATAFVVAVARRAVAALTAVTAKRLRRDLVFVGRFETGEALLIAFMGFPVNVLGL